MEDAPIGYVMVNREELRAKCVRVMAWVEYMHQKRLVEFEREKQERDKQPWYRRWFWEYNDDQLWSFSYWKYRTYDQKEAASACLHMLRNTNAIDLLLSIETVNLLFNPEYQVEL